MRDSEPTARPEGTKSVCSEHEAGMLGRDCEWLDGVRGKSSSAVPCPSVAEVAGKKPYTRGKLVASPGVDSKWSVPENAGGVVNRSSV